MTRRKERKADGWAWCCAVVAVGGEAHAAGRIERDVPGALTWVPRVGHEVVRRGERNIVWETAFPGYVLAKLPRRGAWHPAARSKGVKRWLGPQGGTPDRVADKEFGRLWRQFGGADARVVVRIKHRQRPGEGYVGRVQDGPFASLDCKVSHLLPKRRVEVLVSLFGRQTKVELHEDQVDWYDERLAERPPVMSPRKEVA